MEIPKSETVMVNAKSVLVHVKVSDSGSYALKDADGKEIADRDDYVPSFFPEQHYGDYIILDIELETGKILNWKTPEPKEVAEAFKLIKNDED